MTISALVIADSISKGNKRITSLQLLYPRFVHAEFMTHRVFSRNASSSRAIPVDRLIADIISDTAMPIHWGKNQPGMQADEECDEKLLYHYYGYMMGKQCSRYIAREEKWFEARDNAIKIAKEFTNQGYHKQIVNRLLEPFSHINVIVTATEWDNFFALRRHKDAQPEIHQLADEMWAVMQLSTPRVLKEGEWHLPYVTHTPSGGEAAFWGEDAIKLSVARCARVSYLTHDFKIPDVEQDLKLYDRLVGSVPLHASPAEHQATPDRFEYYKKQHANFQGWRQYRKMIEL